MSDSTLPLVPDGADELVDPIEQLRYHPKKYAAMAALRQVFGNVTAAAKITGVPRRTINHWKQCDPIFKKIFEEEEFLEQQIDFYVQRLHERIDDKDTIATIYALKSKGKNHGWGEKQEAPQLPQGGHGTPSWFKKEQDQLPDTSQWELYQEAEVVSVETTKKQAP